MQVVQQTSELQLHHRPVSVTLGIFDGVHLGHQRLLQLALDDAHDHQGLAIAVTFDRHPNHTLAPDRAPPALQTLEHRLALLERLGLDAAVVIPFNQTFSQLDPATFVRNLVRDLGRLVSICIGQGFTFGHRRAGNVDLLKQLGHELGYITRALAPVTLDHTVIRSTRIRELVAHGQLTQAGALLGRPYSVAGRVVHGDHLGRQIGFPTANLDVAGLVLPPTGVYTARVRLGPILHPAILNLGRRPTLDAANPPLRLEVHLLDFEGDLYGELLEVVFHDRLRPEQRFASLDALRAQIRADVDRARTDLAPPAVAP
jgi:riboflavin kinase / FMN adenylyltransferase